MRVAYSSRHIDRHEGMGGQENIHQSVRLLGSVHYMSKPCDQPTQTEVILTLRPDGRQMVTAGGRHR